MQCIIRIQHLLKNGISNRIYHFTFATTNFYYPSLFTLTSFIPICKKKPTKLECVRAEIAGYIKNSCGNCKSHLINYHVSPYICEGNIRQSNKIFR